jgi:hypothetical protein
LRDELRQWETTAPAPPDPAEVRARANRLALSMIEMGEDAEGTERQLHRWRFHPALAHEATRWAVARHQQARGESAPAAPPAGSDGPAPDAA